MIIQAVNVKYDGNLIYLYFKYLKDYFVCSRYNTQCILYFLLLLFVSMIDLTPSWLWFLFVLYEHELHKIYSKVQDYIGKGGLSPL